MHKHKTINHNDKYVVFYEFDGDGDPAESGESEGEE